MSDDVQRTRAGQFAPGQSGNAAGARSRKPKQLMTLADINRAILKIADSETKMVIENKVQTINMLERNAWVLASGKGNRLSAKDFVELVKSAGAHLDHLERYPPTPRHDGSRQ